MEKLRNLLDETINQQFIQMVISNPRNKKDKSKVKVRPILLKGILYFQEEIYKNCQVYHNNIPWTQKEELLQKILDYMQDFKQLEWKTQQQRYTAFVNRKQQVSITCGKQPSNNQQDMDKFAHNRKKKYLLEENSPIDFLIALGVMNKEGKVVKARYDKFRQINRFLEFIDDVQPHLPKNRPLKVIDFGCGKSYLTFAIYYYLKILKGYDLYITGLDLKQEVIQHCNQLARELDYRELEFLHGDIAEYEGVTQADLVVTLHACDTATDYALAKAVHWNAGVILSVPCCQHELNKQIKNEQLQPIFRYGLVKERTAALFTDALRANLLEQQGYQVQLLEFIDIEHTPKNILIRAVRKNTHSKQTHCTEEPNQAEDKNLAYRQCCEFLGVDLTLEKLLR